MKLTQLLQAFALFILAGSLSAASPVPDQVPEGLKKSDWANIRAAYEAGRHAFQPTANGWQARNPKQQWLTTFDRRGFVAQPEGVEWQWGLELKSYGLDGQERAIGGVPAMRAQGQRLSYQWDAALNEWFINDQRGLEHGFILAQRPEGRVELPLAFTLGVRGGLRPTIAVDALGVAFQDKEGTTVLNYAGLKVWDANGKVLTSRFVSAGEGVRLLVEDRGARYPITIDPIAQQAYLKASNTGVDDRFGYSVAVSGDTVVVGAIYEASADRGVNGDQLDNGFAGAGAAYVFVRRGGAWTQQAYLKASNTGPTHYFGNSVAVSGDTVVVGAYVEDGNGFSGSGAVYVFVRAGETWSQQAYLKASNAGNWDLFGSSVALSDDTLVVGAWGEASNATGVNGDQTNNDASTAGAAYVFVRSGTVWTQQAYLKASNTEQQDRFGYSVAVSGDTAVVGALFEDSNATGVNGNQTNNDASDAGAAYVFVRNGTTWTQQDYLKASNTGRDDGFGRSLAVSGDTVVVGAPSESSNAAGVNGDQTNNDASGAGAAYVFVRSGGAWTQQSYLKASNAELGDYFGISVALSDNTLVVGASGEDSNATGVNGNQTNNDANDAGATYLFARTETTWTQQAYIKPSNTGREDTFGFPVAVSGETVVVGATGEASNAKGLNGDQNANYARGAGAVYVFDPNAPAQAAPPTPVETIAHTNYRATGGTDLFFSKLGAAAIDPEADLLFDSVLSGLGAPNAKNQAIFSTLGNTSLELALQKGTAMPVLGLPATAVIGSLLLPQANQASLGLFQVTLAGKGISPANNRLLLRNDNTGVAPLFRTGAIVPDLASDSLKTFLEVLQSPNANLIGFPYSLNLRKAVTSPAPLPATTAANDSGLLMLNHEGAVIDASAREGSVAFGGGGVFGQFTPRAALTSHASTHFIAKFIPMVVPPAKQIAYDALFIGSTRYSLKGGDSLPAISTTAKLGAFLAVGSSANFTVLRTTLSGVPSAENEVLLDASGAVLQQKGKLLPPSTTLKMAKLLRFWPTSNNQIVMFVQLSGTGVTASTNTALLLRQADGNYLTLARTGDTPPTFPSAVKLAVLSAVDVDPINGHYAILASLSGISSSANQVLLRGQTSLGNDTDQQLLRLPERVLTKGGLYTSGMTPSGRVLGMVLSPAPETSGVGARGLRQVINPSGDIVLTLQTDLKNSELIVLKHP